MARKICIYTTEEVKCLSPKIKHLVSEEARPDKIVPDADIGTEEQSSNAGPSC